jgi:hypothetical protein
MKLKKKLYFEKFAGHLQYCKIQSKFPNNKFLLGDSSDRAN